MHAGDTTAVGQIYSAKVATETPRLHGLAPVQFTLFCKHIAHVDAFDESTAGGQEALMIAEQSGGKLSSGFESMFRLGASHFVLNIESKGMIDAVRRTGHPVGGGVPSGTARARSRELFVQKVALPGVEFVQIIPSGVFVLGSVPETVGTLRHTSLIWDGATDQLHSGSTHGRKVVMEEQWSSRTSIDRRVVARG